MSHLSSCSCDLATVVTKLHSSDSNLNDSNLVTPLLQLTTKDEAGFNPESFKDMIDEEAPLESLGIQHGDMIYLLYDFERQVEGPKLSEFEKRSFGAHMTIESMVAKQTRIERQENALCTSASFEMHAANMFQSYIQSALAFSIKRGGILYGEIDEDSNVLVHAILEPPQEGNADRLMLERGSPSEDAADRVASAFGWQKVGWVFSQSTNERDYIFSAEEVCQMAAIQVGDVLHIDGRLCSAFLMDAVVCSGRCYVALIWVSNHFISHTNAIAVGNGKI